LNNWAKGSMTAVTAMTVTLAAAPAAAATGTFTTTLSCFYDFEQPTPTLAGASVITSVTGAPPNTQILIVGSTAATQGSLYSSGGITDSTGAVSYDSIGAGLVNSEGQENWPLELTAYADTNNDGLSMGPDDIQIGDTVIVHLVCPPPTAADLVDNLIATDALTQGMASALQNRLDAAAAQAEQGNIKTAIGQLKGLRQQVEGLVRAGYLEAADGQALVDAINREIALVLNG
jgi:hypothetical protein